MSIKKSEMPKRAIKSTAGRDLVEFVNSGWDCAEVDLNGGDTNTVYMRYMYTIKRHPEQFAGIRCSRIGGHVYLIRETSEQED